MYSTLSMQCLESFFFIPMSQLAFLGIGLIALTQRQNSHQQRFAELDLVGYQCPPCSLVWGIRVGESLIVIIKGTVLPDCLPLVTIDGAGGRGAEDV